MATMTETTTQLTLDQSESQSNPISSEAKYQSYLSSLTQNNAGALWTQLDKMVPPSPNPAANVCVWPYDKMRAPLMEAGDLISAEEAERRVLMLVNPTLSAPYTTDTIYAGLQLILPGETAPAHRHVAFALRFIVEGTEGGFTAVEGEKMFMSRGDVILTPSWSWHDHGNEGTEPIIWLDGLDLPVYKFLPVNFAQGYSEPRYPSQVLSEERGGGKWRFPWAKVQAKLDENMETENHAVHLYRHADGKYLSNTISAQAERVAAATSSPKARQTCSFVYHVYEGEGYTTITTAGGEETVVQWKARDTFSIPAWSSIKHTATIDQGNAYLFAINDRPMIESLGLYRAE